MSIRSGSNVEFSDEESIIMNDDKPNEPTGGLSVTDGKLVSSTPIPGSPIIKGQSPEGNGKPVVTSPEASMEEEKPKTETTTLEKSRSF